MDERQRDDDPLVEEQTEAAAEEAAEIGGPDPEPGIDPAQRPVVEGGEGYAEGFEQAEADLERFATHADPGGDPLRDEGKPEEDAGSVYGEADHEGAQGEQPD
jgi:hypothetical protein